jgi:hypothetical protein
MARNHCNPTDKYVDLYFPHDCDCIRLIMAFVLKDIGLIGSVTALVVRSILSILYS